MGRKSDLFWPCCDKLVKSISKLETLTCLEELKRKGRREGNGAISNYFYDGAKVVAHSMRDSSVLTFGK